MLTQKEDLKKKIVAAFKDEKSDIYDKLVDVMSDMDSILKSEAFKRSLFDKVYVQPENKLKKQEQKHVRVSATAEPLIKKSGLFFSNQQKEFYHCKSCHALNDLIDSLIKASPCYQEPSGPKKERQQDYHNLLTEIVIRDINHFNPGKFDYDFYEPVIKGYVDRIHNSIVKEILSRSLPGQEQNEIIKFYEVLRGQIFAKLSIGGNIRDEYLNEINVKWEASNSMNSLESKYISKSNLQEAESPNFKKEFYSSSFKSDM